MADSVLKLKVDDKEYNASLKNAKTGMQALEASLQKAGKTFNDCDKKVVEYVRAIGNMETQSKSARGRIGEMSTAFVELSQQYNKMTKDVQSSDVGKALAGSLDELKQRTIGAKQELERLNKELEVNKPKLDDAKGATFDFKSVIGELGRRFGISSELMGTLTSGTIAYTAAIGGAATAVAAATKAWADYNQEIAKQQQVTTVTTGLKGEDADRMTSGARALAKTYNVDFREAINAANTLMTQFGQTGDQALQLLRDGMQGMIQGDGPKLLSMIQQYAPAFRDAGISASQLVAVIQNSEGGIFTDQNMNAIVMGIKNIRLMTKATSDALAQLGIDGEEMSRKLSDGSMSVFDALKQVATAIEDTNSGSKSAGEVMQQVFGRQGAMAGTNLGRAIADLNTNLEETKLQTGEVGKAYNDLYDANVRLEEALHQTFGYKGWEEMATGIKTTLVNAMATVLETTEKINRAFDNNLGFTFFEGIGRAAETALGPLGKILGVLRLINQEKNGGSDVGAGASVGGAISGAISANAGTLPEVVITPTKTPSNRGKGGSNTSKEDTQRDRVLSQWLNAEAKAAKAVEMYNGQLMLSTEAEKLREKQARETAAAAKKLSDAETERATALGGNDLKAFYVANKKVAAAGGTTESATGFTATTANIDAFIGNLKERIASSEVGTDLYNALTAQLADATALSNLLQTAIKNGIDPAQIGLDPKEFWSKVFGENPGDYIEDKTWQGIIDEMNKAQKKGGKKIQMNANTGEVTTKEDKGATEQLQAMNTMISSLGSIATGVQNLGIEVPQGITQSIAVLQTIMGIVSAIQTMQTVGTFLGIFANGGIVHAANGWAGTVPGNSYSGDNIPILANAGEVVLTRAMAGNLASQLEGAGMQNLRLSTELDGRILRIVLNNDSQSRGRGKYVTSTSHFG